HGACQLSAPRAASEVARSLRAIARAGRARRTGQRGRGLEVRQLSACRRTSMAFEHRLSLFEEGLAGLLRVLAAEGPADVLQFVAELAFEVDRGGGATQATLGEPGGDGRALREELAVLGQAAR